MTAIEVVELGKKLGTHWAIEDLSFTVARGEVFGLLGPNGAGKTTTLRILAGLYAPDVGSACVAGCPIKAGEVGDASLRARVGLLTEQPGFYDRLPALYNLVLFGQLYGMTTKEAEAGARKLMDRFGLQRARDQAFSALSRGMKQKLAIARAVLHRPEVVLLDEPTIGLDPESTAEVRHIIGELSAAGGTIVLCTHHLSEVDRLCSRAAVLARRLVGIHDVRSSADTTGSVTVCLQNRGDGYLELARAAPYVRAARYDAAGLYVEVGERSKIPDLIRLLVDGGARIDSVMPRRTALEESYRNLLDRARDQGWLP